MQIWVLGTLEITHEGRPVPLHGRSPRQLLALLALTPGRELSSDRLIDGLWGQRAPEAAAATLQSHIARLRRDLPDPDVIRTGQRGYLLDLAPEDVDAVAFERAVIQGRQALAAGRPIEASGMLAEALSQWRGSPYTEFAGCEPLESHARRLEELRLDALDGRISADLRRPGAAPPVAELEALVRWHPVRESFWGLLMCAHYKAGRQAEALATYRRARAVLAEEVGVDPGPALQELEQLILRQDPSLEVDGMASVLLPAPAGGSYSESVPLVGRADLLDELAGLRDEAMSGAGRLVLVHGEAGVGKSALVQECCRGLGPAVRLLQGACDPLSSPRPLGPLVDVASALGPRVGELLRSGEREGLFTAVLEAIRGLAPAVFVIEDLQWADSSTLDLIRFLARRIGEGPLALVVTFRDDQLSASDPVRVTVGDIAPMPDVRRIAVPPLSREAVAELTGDCGIDPDVLFAETGGNPFFVTEIVASGGEQLPQTVQDAVLARAQRLSSQARLALDSAAVAGSRIEPALLLGLPSVTAEAVDECVAAGMLRFEPPTYLFRHELARQAVLAGILPGRLGALHWQVLDRLRALPISPPPYARLAEHAEMAGDAAAVLEFAVAAGDTAAALGSHREAAYQYGRAAPYADLLDLEARVRLLTCWAQESQTADDHEHAIEAFNRLLALLRPAGRDLEIADALIGLDESYYTIGDNTHGGAFIDEAVAMFEGAPPSRQHAMALARRGAHYVRLSETEQALAWLERGLAMGREVGDPEVEARSLGALAVAFYLLGRREDAMAMSKESLQVALEHDLQDSAARIYQNLAGLTWYDLKLFEAHEMLEQAEQYTAERDLHGHLLCVLATEITMKLDLGRWDEAVEQAHDLLYVRNTGRASRLEPLVALGLIAARRGESDQVWPYLDEARDHIAKSQTLSYQSAIALARGEAHLLEGNADAVRAEAMHWYCEAVRLQAEDCLPELALLVWRAGLIDAPPDGLREPELLSMTGRHREAAAFWSSVGAPYKAAWALLDSDDEVDLREARARFEQLGATALVARTDDKLRSIGARVPRGARASTQANLGGLTDRELDVLDLLDEGLRNAEIAERLHLSEKTVGHHVSSILAKLGVSSRLEAVRRARDLAATG